MELTEVTDAPTAPATGLDGHHGYPAPQSPPDRSRWVWLVTAAMAAAAGMMQLGLVPVSAPADAPVVLAWWVFAIAFALAETTVVHIPVKRDAHTISMSEVPMVLGLALAAPPAVIIGRVVGSFAVLVLRRKNPPIKLAFNLSLFTLEATSAVVIYRLLLGSASPNSLIGWSAALIAVGASVLASAALVDTVLAIMDARRSFSEIVRSFATGSLISVGVAFLGALAVVLVWVEPLALLVLGGTTTLFYFLVRVQGMQSRQYDDLQALHGFTNHIVQNLGTQDSEIIALAEAVDILRAERGAMLLLSDDVAGGIRSTVDPKGELVVAHLADKDAAHLVRLASLAPAGRLCGGLHADSVIGAGPRQCSIVAPIIEGGTPIGALVVTGRNGPERHFTQSELELLDTLASQASLTLERSRIIDRLRTEITAKQEIIRSKDQLIAAVSHEFRTPLTGVLGFAEMLRDKFSEYEPDIAQTMLDSIANDAMDLSNLVEDLLTVARTENGSLSITRGPVRLREAMHQTTARIGGQAHHVTISGEQVVAYADEQRVRQIVRNLFTNALRYGGHQIRLTAHIEGGMATLRVSDNGDGIPEHDQERIFTAYHSAHPAGTQPGSLGLGLTISRSLARLMDGDLVYGHANGWTVFELTLPLLSLRSTSDPRERSVTDAATMQDPATNPERSRVHVA